MLRIVSEHVGNHTPPEVLYHYTTLKGLLGIVRSQSIWASEMRYMNDSAEMFHALDLLRCAIKGRRKSRPEFRSLYDQMLSWLDARVGQGQVVFAASFRGSGNLLSQWRGYTSIGTGVSLGFKSHHLEKLASRQGFRFGKCIYNPDEQQANIDGLLDEVESISCTRCAQQDDTGEQCLADMLESVKPDVLHLAALLKHPAFTEEEEWRLISPVIELGCHPEVSYRVGHSMLVPYLPVDLKDEDSPLQLQHVFVGPTPNPRLSVQSLGMYLRQERALPVNGIEDSQIPYRQA